MIEILLKFDIPEHYEEVKSELVQCGFRDFHLVNGDEIKLPTNTLYHPQLLNLLAVDTIVNICIFRLNRKLNKRLVFTVIEVKNLTLQNIN